MSKAAESSRSKGNAGASLNVVAPPPAKAMDAGPNSRAAIQTWTGKAIGDQIHAKSLANAYRQWLFHRGSRQPRLRDMYANASNSFDDTLLNLKVGNEHIIVAQSEGYIRNVGRDLRGALTSELKFATANSLRELFDDCLASKQPIYARYISSLSDQNVYWETLILPLAVDDRSDPIFTMCCLAMLSEKVDVLQILYDRSPVGIIAAVPIMNGQNKTDDARVLTMNARAKQILKLDPARSQPNTVGELIHFLRDSLRWSGVNTSAEGPMTRVDYRDPAGLKFSMTIELINQFVLISVAEQVRATGHDRPEVATTSRFARLLGLA